MTLSVVTGKPGHGKTLYAVTIIEKKAKAENRTVYYNGIPDLKLDWELLEDATNWHVPEHVPDGAIIVIDEAQRTFPPRSTGSRVPAHVQPFDTHRHRGLDIYLITQDPMLIDSFARNLAGEHIHVLRPFGTQQAKIYRWEHVVDPDSRSEKTAAVDTSFFRYPKESFELYKSATVHTVKRSIPWKLAVGVPLLVTALVVSLIVAYKVLTTDDKKTDSKGSSGKIVSSDSANDSTKPMTSSEYQMIRVSRVPGHPESAPIYDEIAKPTVLPIMAGCVQSADSCTCYTQQGTKIYDAPLDTCAHFVRDGSFVAYDDKTLGVPDRRQAPEQDQLKDLQRQIQIKKLKDELRDLELGIEKPMPSKKADESKSHMASADI